MTFGASAPLEAAENVLGFSNSDLPQPANVRRATLISESAIARIDFENSNAMLFTT
jgi:hypothetical protein